MKFENLIEKWEELSHRNNDTVEKVFEWEFYDLVFHLLDCLHAFEEGRRKPLRSFDYYELLETLKQTYRTFKGNIKYLEER